jgi:hypothetical protein
VIQAVPRSAVARDQPGYKFFKPAMAGLIKIKAQADGVVILREIEPSGR